MKEITLLLNRYRECARHVWNTFFLPSVLRENTFEIVENFEKVNSGLFSQLVLAALPNVVFRGTLGKDPVPLLRVIPNPNASAEVPILVNRPSADKNKYWDDPVNRISAKDAEFLFVTYFDWDQLGVADFQYYRVSILSFPKHPHLVGREALLEVQHCKVFVER